MEVSIHENTYSISSVSVSVEKIVVTIHLWQKNLKSVVEIQAVFCLETKD